ncbi:MAG: DUF721 domain-containing protein [Candidatus Omnitrophica bacterium]|nr:DUF721 domain-containing protein [Candidatus Omnitrophota bacterium]
MIEKDFSQLVAKVMNDPSCVCSNQRRQYIVDWDKIWAEVSKDASKYSYFLKFKDGKLWIAVKNSAWMLELNKRRLDLIKSLQKKTGEKISEIKFVR